MSFTKTRSTIQSILFLILLPCYLQAQQRALSAQKDRWQMMPDGAIRWQPGDRLPHTDHIEMSGQKTSLWVKYEIDCAGVSRLTRTVVFPTFRMLPDDTRSHVSFTFSDDELPKIFCNGNQINLVRNPATDDRTLKVGNIYQNGIMMMDGMVNSPESLKIERYLFPSATLPMAVEIIRVTNAAANVATIEMDEMTRREKTDSLRSKGRPHTLMVESVNAGSYKLKQGESAIFGITYRMTDLPDIPFHADLMRELADRKARIKQILKPLQLVTPDSVLNTAFAFAKIRATESIFKTKTGYLHSPGGLSYYAAIWANDQAEYVNPFFAFTGDSIANASAMNSYRLFARYMNLDYRPIPSSIVAEGDTTWHGAGDRGDQAMIAYGASRYALTVGSADSARLLWPLIKWCLEYNRRHLNADGVVLSNTDELEGRFPAGNANLSTSCLYYDALISAGYLGRNLGISKSETESYSSAASNLKVNIEKYFGAQVQGFQTYRYYKNNETLRAWICIPLTMGIYDRSDGTIDALFSPTLWTNDGLATESGKNTFWDRSTLYALRGVFQAGATSRALSFLHYYSQRRLLGDHVPYPVEAYPEGNQRHLSAESGLYCRIFIEGMFGIRPRGLNVFDCTPRLPENWNDMSLNNIHAFGTVFDLQVQKSTGGKLKIIVRRNGRAYQYAVKNGGTAKISL